MASWLILSSSRSPGISTKSLQTLIQRQSSRRAKSRRRRTAAKTGRNPAIECEKAADSPPTTEAELSPPTRKTLKENTTMDESGKGSQTDSTKKKGNISFRWNRTDEEILLTMLHAIHKKNGCNSTFQWSSVAQQFKEKTMKDLPGLVIKNKYNYMKKQYTAWNRLRYNVTGAGWDEEKFKVTTSEEWWEKQRYEDFFPFKKTPPLRQTSRMWDDLFETVVASGKNAVSTSAEQFQFSVQETCVEESSGGNDSDVDPQDVDDELETPLGATQNTPESVPSKKKSKKSKAYTPAFSTESIKKHKPTPGNKLFADSCEMVSNASRELIKAVKSSAGGTSGPEQDAEFDAAVAELNLLVALGLVEEDSSLWCYGMTGLAKADRRRIFMRCTTEKGKTVWLQYEFDMAVARLLR